MEKHYFTFGTGQEHAGKYVIIRAQDPVVARAQMVDRFGEKWSFQYTEKEWYEDGKALHKTHGWELLDEIELAEEEEIVETVIATNQAIPKGLLTNRTITGVDYFEIATVLYLEDGYSFHINHETGETLLIYVE